LPKADTDIFDQYPIQLSVQSYRTQWDGGSLLP